MSARPDLLTLKMKRVLEAMAHGRKIRGVWAWTRTTRDGGLMCRAPFRTLCGPFVISPDELVTLVRSGYVAKSRPIRPHGCYEITAQGRAMARRRRAGGMIAQG